MLDASSTRKNIDMNRPWYRPALSLLDDIPHKGTVLDLGCGLGEFSERLKHEGFEDITCADGSPKYVVAMKKKGYSAHSFDFDGKFPFKSDSFDLVVSLEVIEHLQNAELFVKEINRILSPGGYLVISTPNIAYLGLRLRGLLGLPPPDEGYHFRFFTFKTLSRLLVKNRFKILKHRSITFLHGVHKIFGCKPIVISAPLFPNLFAVKSVLLARKK